MPAPEVETFIRAIEDAVALLRRVATAEPLDRPTHTQVTRALADAENRFVRAHPKLGASQAQRFRSLLLQARKLNDKTLSFEALRFASQFSDALLLIEVEDGLAKADHEKGSAKRPGDASTSRDSTKALVTAQPASANASQPSSATNDSTIHPLSSPPPQHLIAAKHKPRTLPWHKRLSVRMAASAVLGMAIVGGIAIVMHQVGESRAQARQDRRQTREALKPLLTAPPPRAPRYVPPATLGTDGPIVSVTPIEVRDTNKDLASDALLVEALDWIDARFSRTKDPAGTVADMVSALRSPKAEWRENGRLGALADCMTAASALTTYPGSQNLTTSEILTAQGGDLEWLSLAYAHIGMRLGLVVTGVSGGDGQRAYAIVESHPFGPSPRPAKPGSAMNLSTAALRLALAVAQREAAAAHRDYPALDRALNVLRADQGTRERLFQTWRAAIVTLLPTMERDAAAQLLSEHRDLPLGSLGAAAIEELARSLGPDRVTTPLLEAWLAARPDARFADGVLAAVALYRMSADEDSSGEAGGARQSKLLEILSLALEKSPVDFPRAMGGIGGESNVKLTSQIATQLWERGVRHVEVAAEVAREALRREAPDRLYALGVMLVAVRLAIVNDNAQQFGVQRAELPPIALVMARHAATLALELQQYAALDEFLDVALKQWPRDEILWRVMAESAIAQNDRATAQTVLSRLAMTWPSNEPIRQRLAELVTSAAEE